MFQHADVYLPSRLEGQRPPLMVYTIKENVYLLTSLGLSGSLEVGLIAP